MKTSTAWFLACRPKTLSVSLSPVLVGSAIAWHDSGALLWLPLLAAALGAARIEVGYSLEGGLTDLHMGRIARYQLAPERPRPRPR